jgi:hypothetical protein
MISAWVVGQQHGNVFADGDDGYVGAWEAELCSAWPKFRIISRT